MNEEAMTFGEAFLSFYSRFFSFSIFFEILCIAFLALQSTGSFKRNVRSALMAALHGLALVAFTFPLTQIGYAFGAIVIDDFRPLMIILFMLLPGVVYIAAFGKGFLWHRVLRVLFFFSSSYVCTEIAHHYNMLVGPSIDDAGLRQFLFCLPFLLLVALSIAVGYLKIHHVRRANVPLTVMSLLIFLSDFLFALFSSSITFSAPDEHALFIILLFILLIVDYWGFYVYYRIDKTNRVISTLEAEAQLNQAAAIMLRMNEESIARTTAARHDLKNTLAYIHELIRQNKYDEASAFVEETEKKTYGDLPIVDCGNGVVSAIMNLERKKAGYEDVTLKYRLVVPPVLPLNDTVVCSLLTNIIDNAIAGTKDSGMEGYVDFSMVVSNSVLRIRCVNPTNLSTIPTRSSKMEVGHGHGMNIIKNLVKECGGYVTFDVASNTFHVDAVIGLDMEEQKEN